MFDYYIDTLTEYLQEFLDRNEIECNVELGRDFAYLHSESKIIYALLVVDKCGKSFLSFAERYRASALCILSSTRDTQRDLHLLHCEKAGQILLCLC